MAPASKVTLRQSATCPNCMGKFAPEDVLWVSSHQSLAGDRRLRREDALMRFLPSRFSPEGFAIDPKGVVCKKLACPNCHLEIPREVLESRIKFFSIIGTPGSGKSFLLACMTHELRRVMQDKFLLRFFDPDPTFNNALIQYENNIFHNPAPDKQCTPDDLIRRTQELDDSLFNEVLISDQAVNLAKPFIFQIEPGNGHPRVNNNEHRLISLYDNSGESFKTGKDTSENQVTIHLREADALFYLFDPTQNIRIRKEAERVQQQSMNSYKNIDDRQETILSEALTRIWRHRGLSASNKYDCPLIVILTKWDSWCHLVPDVSMADPFISQPGKGGQHLLSIPAIKQASKEMKKFLENYAPNIVNACENFAQDVIYIPVSSFGSRPTLGPENKAMIKPSEIRPIWASVPMLYALAKTVKDILPLWLKSPDDATRAPKNNRQ